MNRPIVHRSVTHVPGLKCHPCLGPHRAQRGPAEGRAATMRWAPTQVPGGVELTSERWPFMNRVQV